MMGRNCRQYAQIFICLFCGFFCGIALAEPAAQDYLLGADDVVRVQVFGYEDLTTEARISQTGSITVPLLGEVSIAGLSSEAAASRIGSKLVAGGFIREPKVSVMVLQFESQKVSVMGQVSKPGNFPLSAASSLLDVLAEAGGLLTETAGDRATLVRKTGAKEVIDLTALFEGDASQNFKVGAGDMIFVPKAPQFYIYGEVQRPGVYRLERNMRVDQAITAGGGLTERGSESRVILRRRVDGGAQKEIHVNDSTLLQPNDVVFVKESWF